MVEEACIVSCSKEKLFKKKKQKEKLLRRRKKGIHVFFGIFSLDKDGRKRKVVQNRPLRDQKYENKLMSTHTYFL